MSRGAAILLPLAVLLCFCARPGNSEVRLPGDLLARAEAAGAVRVIATLRAQGDQVAAIQDRVLKALEGTRHRVTRRFTAIPALALEVSPEALRRLAGMTEVVGLEEDRLLGPQGGTP